MLTLQELYNHLAKSSLNGNLDQEVKRFHKDPETRHSLDCLLHPEKHPVVWRTADCDCSEEEKAKCASRCLFDALHVDEKGNVSVDVDQCVGCSQCIDRCKAEHLAASKDVLPVLAAIKEEDRPVYAIIAPAFLSQFSNHVTPGKLRSAFKQLGFTGMVEVALFADILTLKEALEFDATVQTDQDFLLTSCCCPMWIAMIRKVYHQLVPHVPGSVSPMVACGRVIKHLRPGATVVFIGPCLAKKAEAKEKDIADAVDYVLTFQEVKELFDLVGLDPAGLPEDEREHSSKAGRIYARTGGVSQAVKSTVARLRPDRSITVHARQADGVPACREMLNALKEGKITENFLEGMGCQGGCVGGPRAIIDRKIGAQHVDEYGEEAPYETPLDNPFVLELLKRLGFDTVEDLLKHDTIFTRRFD